jgi:hypothetical protein
LKNILTNVDANRSFCSSFRNLDDVGSFTATEINDNLSFDSGEEVIAQQDLKPSFAATSPTATTVWGAGRDCLQNSILNIVDPFVQRHATS